MPSDSFWSYVNLANEFQYLKNKPPPTPHIFQPGDIAISPASLYECFLYLLRAKGLKLWESELRHEKIYKSLKSTLGERKRYCVVLSHNKVSDSYVVAFMATFNGQSEENFGPLAKFFGVPLGLVTGIHRDWDGNVLQPIETNVPFRGKQDAYVFAIPVVRRTLERCTPGIYKLKVGEREKLLKVIENRALKFDKLSEILRSATIEWMAARAYIPPRQSVRVIRPVPQQELAEERIMRKAGFNPMVRNNIPLCQSNNDLRWLMRWMGEDILNSSIYLNSRAALPIRPSSVSIHISASPVEKSSNVRYPNFKGILKPFYTPSWRKSVADISRMIK